jgi:hypothetical protein
LVRDRSNDLIIRDRMVIDTTKAKIGRESVVFFRPLISDGPEMSAHKNSFSGTLM